MLFSRSRPDTRQPDVIASDGPLVQLRNIEKAYQHGTSTTYVLRRISVDVKEGEFVSIMGPSGAGKSTLLHIIGMHDTRLDRRVLASRAARARARRRRSAPSSTRSTSGSSSRATTCSTT